MKKYAIFGSCPWGRGGMETIISILKEAPFAKFVTIFFDFKNGRNKERDWLEASDHLIFPCQWYPRILQELIVVRQLRNLVEKDKYHVIICLDERACRYAKKAIAGLDCVLVSWIHGSLHTLKNKQNICLADVHVAISHGIASQLISLRVPLTSIYEIPNCVNDRPIFLKEKKQKKFVFVGRLELEGNKQLKLLFDAFHEIKEHVCLEVIGDGPDRELCVEYCRKLSILDRVRFIGWQNDPWQLINQGKEQAIVCLTSLHEGFPMVLIEAISNGCFCIAADCPTGPREIINDKNGLLFPVGDKKSLIDCMEKALNQKINIQDVVSSASPYTKGNFYKSWQEILESLEPRNVKK